MAAQDEYKVRLEVFEGPLDLLLYLIKKNEVDVYNIPIETITTQYMEYLNLMKMLDLNIAGEFIVMAATLMMIKSRMLLPVEERPEALDDEEGEDPRWDLVRQLVEYKKFKDAAMRLQEREMFQENIFVLGSEGAIPEPDDPGLGLQDVSLFDLIAAFNEVLKRAKPEEWGEIYADKWTVGDKIDVILDLIRTRREIPFSKLFGERAGRHEIICTFLALLELIRLRQVNITQKSHFAEITLHGIEDAPPVPLLNEDGEQAESEPGEESEDVPAEEPPAAEDADPGTGEEEKPS